MKITKQIIKKLIKESIDSYMLSESQVKLGIPHGVDLKENPEVLYQATMNFIQRNPDLSGGEARENAKLLMRILDNTIQGTVRYTQGHRGDMSLLHRGEIDDYMASIGHETTPEEIAHMRDQQGRLKMAQRALGSMLGGSHAPDYMLSSWQDSRRDFFRDNPNYIPGSKDWDDDY